VKVIRWRRHRRSLFWRERRPKSRKHRAPPVPFAAPNWPFRGCQCRAWSGREFTLYTWRRPPDSGIRTPAQFGRIGIKMWSSWLLRVWSCHRDLSVDCGEELLGV